MNVEESNKLIAEFMGEDFLMGNGVELIPLGEWNNKNTMRFNSSWDWLMSVVDKIRDLGWKVELERVFTAIRVGNDTPKFYEELTAHPDKPSIEITYEAVVKFITWYNEKKESKS